MTNKHKNLKLTKKNSYPLAALAVVIIAGVVAFIVFNGNSPTADKAKNVTYKPSYACDLLTLGEAKTLLGDQTTAGQNAKPVTSDSISNSTCSYTNNATTLSEIKTATVMVRSGLDSDGASSNKAGFNSFKSDRAVEGYGQSAYWSAERGQLNILDHNNWIIVSMGGTDPSKFTVDDAKLVADKVLN